jgi:hypothetical protein
VSLDVVAEMRERLQEQLEAAQYPVGDPDVVDQGDMLQEAARDRRDAGQHGGRSEGVGRRGRAAGGWRMPSTCA